MAIWGRIYIDSPYIYEVCDLTELTIGNRLIRDILSYANKRVIKKSIKYVSINNKLYELIGDVCMDMIQVKVDNTIKLYDEVEIFGKNITAAKPKCKKKFLRVFLEEPPFLLYLLYLLLFTVL